ncbi:MAG: DUF4838 domain-containing protein [Planctomycetota bacterium]|jgi:hypothetical protein
MKVGTSFVLPIYHSLSGIMLHRRKIAKRKMQPEEYYGIINGKIDYNIPRLSSELVKKDFVSYLEAVDRAFPGIEYFCIGQPDGWMNLHYEDKAAGWDKLAERGPRGRFSDYSWKFNMDIRKRLMEKYPDRKLSIFAYSNTRRIPASVDKVPENVTIGFCQTANGWMDPTNTELRDRNEWLDIKTSCLFGNIILLMLVTVISHRYRQFSVNSCTKASRAYTVVLQDSRRK